MNFTYLTFPAWSRRFSLYTFLVKIENRWISFSLFSLCVNLIFTFFTFCFRVITHEIPTKKIFSPLYTSKVKTENLRVHFSLTPGWACNFCNISAWSFCSFSKRWMKNLFSSSRTLQQCEHFESFNNIFWPWQNKRDVHNFLTHSIAFSYSENS